MTVGPGTVFVIVERLIVKTVRVPPLQYVVTVRIRCLVGRLVRRARIFVADLLEPHLRLRFLGVVVGSDVTVRTVVVCLGFLAGQRGGRRRQCEDRQRGGGAGEMRHVQKAPSR